MSLLTLREMVSERAVSGTDIDGYRTPALVRIPWRTMKRITRLVVAAALTLILAACTTPASTLEYRGSSITSDATHELRLSLEEPSAVGIVRDTYFTGVARGALRGTLDGEELTAELQPSPDCTYSFTGILTETRPPALLSLRIALAGCPANGT